MDLFTKNKGQVTLGNAPALVIVLVVIGIVLAIGAVVLEEFQNQLVPGSTGFNATGEALAGIDTFASFQSVIAIVLVAALILGLVALITFARG